MASEMNGAPWIPWLVRPLRILALLYVLYLVALFFLQRSMLFPRSLVHAPTPNLRAPHVTIDTEVGPIRAWLLPGVGVDATHPGPAVVFAHGNGELAEDWIEVMSTYQALGVTVLLPEYRGYGGMPGTPSQAALTKDFVRFYDLLAARPEVDPKRIVIHGRSVGGGVACALAHERKPAALILQSTFSSVASMAKKYFAPSFLVRDPFDNASVVASLDVPIFLAHGKRDLIIPYSNVLELRQRAPQALLVSYDSDHNDTPPDWRAYMREVQRFLTSAGVLRAPIAHE